ncbi:MAG: phosphoribosylanthranilate isomerase [Parasphingorhabdus sp.]
MKTQIKICGLSSQASISAAAKAGANYIGLVHFEKSPRHVTIEQAVTLKQAVPDSVKTVLLLVNADAKTTGQAINILRPDVIQFHGSETPEWIKLVRDQGGIEVWKALGVRDKMTLAKSNRFEGVVDRLLFDAPAKALPGGTGTSFDWTLFDGYEHRIPWGLAGGLGIHNVRDAIKSLTPQLVDVSSGVESSPGVKDVDKIAAFCQAVRDA